MNILLSILCFVMGTYLAFFHEPIRLQETLFKGGLWVTRDAKGHVLSTSPHQPVFNSPLDFAVPIKGIKTYGYEWKIEE
jgi:hypothetical protein